MVFTNAGKNRVRDLINSDLSYGELGSDTSTPSATETTLVSATTGTSQTVTTQTADKQVIVDYVLPSTAAQGSTLGEFGLFNASSTMYARFTFATLTHSSTDQWQLSTRLWVD